MSADAVLHQTPSWGEPGEPQGCLSDLNPPFLPPQELGSPAKAADGVQPGEHARRHCKSAVSTLLGHFARVSWRPTHTACRSHSAEPLTESNPLLRDFSYQLSRQLLCLHSQTCSIPLLLRRHPQSSSVGFPPHSPYPGGEQ